MFVIILVHQSPHRKGEPPLFLYDREDLPEWPDYRGTSWTSVAKAARRFETAALAMAALPEAWLVTTKVVAL